MQRGLVDDRALDEGGAVALPGQAQPVKPGGPPAREVPFEPNLITSSPGIVGGRRLGFAHELNVDVDVVKGHHHVW